VENGLPTVQINGVPTGKMPEAIDALVISLKTRSCPVVEATQQSLAALSWLQQQGCKQIYFKDFSDVREPGLYISALPSSRHKKPPRINDSGRFLYS
jgi:hypothetical protein